jgi:hypothetical protein
VAPDEGLPLGDERADRLLECVDQAVERFRADDRRL